jgi:pyridinium-3,5-biscarboxylic acid mononucleotide sulfurtransferase
VIRLDSFDGAALERARGIVRQLESVLVAYSGGVDSTLLLRVALDELGSDSAIAVLASSPAFPAAEQEEARQLARALGVRLEEVETHETDRPEYLENKPDRCFHCREELFGTLEPLRERLGLRWLAYGATADDAGDHRPGHGSAVRRGVRFPLLEAGMGKSEIRSAARRLGLPNWDKPSFACLSSRIPHGTPVTVAALRQIERAEAVVKALGFAQVRVRHHGDVARVEVEPGEVEQLFAHREAVVEGLKEAGYTFVALDLEGYSTGSLNRTWKPKQP